MVINFRVIILYYLFHLRIFTLTLFFKCKDVFMVSGLCMPSANAYINIFVVTKSSLSLDQPPFTDMHKQNVETAHQVVMTQ